MAAVRQAQAWLQQWWARLVARLTGSQASALPLTGLLGLAAVLYGLYQLRGSGSRPAGSVPGRQQQPAPSAAEPGRGTSSPQHLEKAPSRVRARLLGVRLILVAAPGVLFEQSTAEELEEEATLVAGAAEVLQELCACSAVCITAHVASDVGEAVVKGTLEAAGLLGSAPGQLPEHRVLCCSTPQGKESIARQLEPGLYIDADPQTVAALQRFLPRLMLVQHGSRPPDAGHGAQRNVTHAASLAAAFQL